MKYMHGVCIGISLLNFSLTQALTYFIHNNIDKKVRVTLWYTDARPTHACTAKKHSCSIYLRPHTTKRVRISEKKHPRAQPWRLMATNTRSREEWACIGDSTLLKHHTFEITYDHAGCFSIKELYEKNNYSFVCDHVPTTSWYSIQKKNYQ